MGDKIERHIVDAADLAALTELLEPLVGETCRSVVLGYGDELRLELGDSLPAWAIYLRATPWELRRPLDLVARSSDLPDDDLPERLRVLEGRRVEACTVRFPDLQLVLAFSDGWRLVVGPEGEAGDVPSADDPLAYWRVFTPDRMVVSVGPGTAWTYGSADSPFT